MSIFSQTICFKNAFSWGNAYSFFTLLQAGVKFCFFVFSAKILGPLAYASWPLILAILSYSMFIGFGVEPALGRELAICRGGNKHFRYNLLLGNSFIFFSYLWFTILAITLVLLFILPAAHIYLLGVLLAILQNVIQFFVKIHRSTLNFKRLAISSAISSLWLLISFFIILYNRSFNILFILFFLSLLIQLLIVLDIKSIHNALLLKITKITPTIIYLFKDGVPLMTSGIIISLLFSIDRWFVKVFFSDIVLGKYALAVFGAMGIQLLITSVGQVYYPTIAHAYGASNRLSNQKKEIFLFLILTLLLILTLILVVWLLLPFVVTHWFPDYQEGLNAAKWMVLGGIFLPFATLSSILLRVKKILWPLVAGQLVGLLLGACIIYFGCKCGTLSSVGVSVALSYFVYSLCVISVSVIFFWSYFSVNTSQIFIFSN